MKQTKQTQNSKKQKYIISIIVLLLLLGSGLTFILVKSNSETNRYIDAIDKQYSSVTNNKSSDKKPVTLTPVLLGEIINPKYRKIKSLTGEYDQLFNSLLKYEETVKLHNQMVKQYNNSLTNDSSLDSEILNLATSFKKLLQDNYPQKTVEIKSVDKVIKKIESSTKFSEISANFSDLIHQNSKWLDTERNNIEAARQKFQAKINES